MTFATAQSQWWHLALTSPLMLRCIVLMIVAAILFSTALLVMRRTRRALHRQAGTATIEFALVFPIALFMALLLTQTTLVMAGNAFVHYAAFAATRSAVTQIPADYTEIDGEARNVLAVNDNSPKFTAIHRAAAIALVPISGRLSSGEDTSEFTRGLTEYFAAYGTATPAWVERLMPDRLRYALANTSVTVMTSEIALGQVIFRSIDEGQQARFAPKQAVTVRIEHAMNLSTPLASAVFADSDSNAQGGSGRSTRVTAQYTLTNEGIDPSLPEKPTIDRIVVY